ncbi:mevalonate kinase [Brachybacterium sacelli]|uniref:mevalonate kinase n=1 Tax=Brachybacterium sacelli TaxID=173364 RepID=A0ABS4WY07_9MICO|nr:mevalonate kinase [Brachybacterium sacelli]MBP2380394.1 mevalonate kinase [Brachybacterium sacelli]
MTSQPPAPVHAPAVLGTGRAHAKAILLGEHSVVYGAPAIAVPVSNLTSTATLRPTAGSLISSSLYQGPSSDAPSRLAPVQAAWRAAAARVGARTEGFELVTESALPIARGLGSSAAIAAAIVRAVADAAGITLEVAEEHELIQEAERAAHGTPSGIDARTVVAETPIRFERGAFQPLPVGSAVTLVIADTGQPGATSRAVASVRALRDRDPAMVDTAIARLGELAEGSVTDLAAGDHAELGLRLRSAQELLVRLGVSSPELDTLVQAAHAAGSPGAKLTGGGQGGCVIALAPSVAEAGPLSRALEEAGAAQVWTTVIGETA